MKNFKNLLKDNFGHYVVLEIDGVKKLMRNGQSGQYVVSENDEVIKIQKRGASKRLSFNGPTLTQIQINDEWAIVDKLDQLSIIADSISFEAHIGKIIKSGHVSFTKYDINGKRTANIKQKFKLLYEQI